MSDDFEIMITKDGSPTVFSYLFQATYHSLNGALQESQHVFIENGFKVAQQKFTQLNILEIGFGTGLNAFLSLQQKNENGVYYHTIEKHPLPSEIYSSLNNNGDFQLLHKAEWEKDVLMNDKFILHKSKIALENFVPDKKFHLIYFDAFAPPDQIEMWEPSLLNKLYDALLPGGILVTYCANGAFKRTLKQMGLIVESPPGAAGKREMTRASKPF